MEITWPLPYYVSCEGTSSALDSPESVPSIGVAMADAWEKWQDTTLSAGFPNASKIATSANYYGAPSEESLDSYPIGNTSGGDLNAPMIESGAQGAASVAASSELLPTLLASTDIAVSRMALLLSPATLERSCASGDAKESAVAAMEAKGPCSPLGRRS